MRGQLIDLYDVDTIEVVRGPQTTRFGRNAEAGAIAVTTRAPGREYRGGASIRYGSYDTQVYQASVAGPVWRDKAFVNLAGIKSRRDGYVRNVFRHEPLDDRDLLAGRVRLVAEPFRRLEVALTGEGEHARDGPTALVPIDAPNPFRVAVDAPGRQRRLARRAPAPLGRAGDRRALDHRPPLVRFPRQRDRPRCEPPAAVRRSRRPPLSHLDRGGTRRVDRCRGARALAPGWLLRGHRAAASDRDPVSRHARHAARRPRQPHARPLWPRHGRHPLGARADDGAPLRGLLGHHRPPARPRARWRATDDRGAAAPCAHGLLRVAPACDPRVPGTLIAPRVRERRSGIPARGVLATERRSRPGPLPSRLRLDVGDGPPERRARWPRERGCWSLLDPSAQLPGPRTPQPDDVMRNGAAATWITGGSTERALDARAAAAYRTRLAALDEELAEAERHHDLGRATRLGEERDLLREELAAAARGRRAASHAERARIAVTKALKVALALIAESHPALGAHLAATVRRGYCCAYVPDPRTPIEWVS